MDPLSDVLSLLKPRSYMSGAFDAGGDWSVEFGRHDGIKCYVLVSGQCWLLVEAFPTRKEVVSTGLVSILLTEVTPITMRP